MSTPIPAQTTSSSIRIAALWHLCSAGSSAPAIMARRRRTHDAASCLLRRPSTLVLSACGVGGRTSNNPVTVGSVTCTPASSAVLSSCWELVAPLGSGGSSPEKGSLDSPKLAPGRWPLTLEPVIGFKGDFWIMGQPHAWSSSDGRNWTHYSKTDSGERISQQFAFLDGQLWMFGGLRYHDRVPLNDVWSSAGGAAWTNMGNADWSPPKGQTIVPFRNRLWLFGGADQVRHDFSTVQALRHLELWRWPALRARNGCCCLVASRESAGSRVQ